MENQLLPNNITLAELRRLMKATKKIAGPKEAVCISLSMWHYDDSVGTGRLDEKIGVYRSGRGPTKEFSSLKDAHDYLKTMKKGEV